MVRKNSGSGGGGGQPLDSDLTAIAALATTSYGRALLTLADAAALRTAAGITLYPFGAVTAPSGVSAATTSLANAAFFSRWFGGGTFTKIAMVVTTSSGNIDVGAYSNTGAGKAALPNARIGSSGSVAMPAAGYVEVSLTASTAWEAGDWAAVSIDNGTAVYRATAGDGSNAWDTGLRCYHTASFPLPASIAPVGGPDRLIRMWGIA